ncbi:MAG: RNA-binding domain-containing protein [Candidatus Hadarchaeum sp.]
MKLRVETEIRTTESREKVEAAVRNIFPDLKLELVGQKLVGESTDIASLSKIHQLLRQQAILDTARSTMFANRKDNTTEFMLNKQVAFVGKISFTDGESPLGPIKVHLEASDIERLIDYLAPRTREGKPVQELNGKHIT